jgi:energy-coupling factor transporter ATP-binding protein EcfA2
MTSPWSDFPSTYRSKEIQLIIQAIQAGECVSVVGLSGAGKSNLLGFLANRIGGQPSLPRMVLIDCNRLSEPSSDALFRLIRSSLGDRRPASDEFNALFELIGEQIGRDSRLCLLLDRFELLSRMQEGSSPAPAGAAIFGNLRALRDAYKYHLTFVIASRRPLEPDNELAELFFAHTLWLGPLSESDALWNIQFYAGRKGLQWDQATIQGIIGASAGYPALLRAVCEAVAAGAQPNVEDLSAHPAVRRRLAEFWADQPDPRDLGKSGLGAHPLINISRPVQAFDASQLTAKEHRLWEYFHTYPSEVCEKDDLIRAVWPEDQIYEQGIRDDSLAQLVRRLREKIESDPSHPRYIQTIPGRGYRFIP